MTTTVVVVTRLAGIAALAMLTACEGQKSRNPLSPNVAGPIAGVAITAPQPVSPAEGSWIVNTEPLRLVFANASSNGERPFWYVVELASDRDFNSKLYTKGNITPADGGQTEVFVDGTLAVERTYFWRVKADDGANASEFSAPASFDLIAPIVIDTPGPVSPVGGQTIASLAPTLTVNNGRISGRTGHVDYWFEIAMDQGFASIVSQPGAARTSGNTTSVAGPSLSPNTTYFWRVLGTNGTIFSPWSAPQSFRTGAAPGGGGGGGGSPGPSPGPPSAHCGPQPLGADRFACVQAVAGTSSEWPHCQAGSGPACHRFVREVARALAAGDANWGLLGKGPGQWQCTTSHCGGLGGEGFGEDIVAYCTNGATCRNRNSNDGRADWQGFDIVVAAGIPGASLSWQTLPQAWNRGNNFWSPVP